MGCAKGLQWQRSLVLFQELLRDDLVPDAMTSAVLMRACVEARQGRIALAALAESREIQFNYPTTKNLYLFIYAILRLSFMSNFCAEFPHKLLLLILNCSGLDTHYIVYLVKLLLHPLILVFNTTSE